MQVNVRNPTFSNGSVWSNGDKECLQDSSTTKFLPQLDGDTVDICLIRLTMTRKETDFYGLSPTLIKTARLFSAWTPPHPKVAQNSSVNTIFSVN